jgi:cell division protein FtsW
MNRATRLTNLIACLSILLALLGVIMVFSSSAFQTGSVVRRSVAGEEGLTPVYREPGLPLLRLSGTRGYCTQLFFVKQMIWAALGITAMLLASKIDYTRWRTWALPVIFVSIGLLLLTWSPLGITSHNARSWIGFGLFTIQPAEFAKVGLVIFLAHLLSKRQDTLRSSLLRTFPMFAVPGLVVLLILLQPDIGMATLVVALIVAMWFLSGAMWRHLILMGMIAACALTAIYFQNDNARRRVETFLYPEKASAASQYQLRQAKIAMASGSLCGVGLGEGQQKMHFLPAPHTDFIFAILGEELGFVASISVIVAYGALIFSGLYVALRIPDLYGTLLAAGLTLMIALGILVNIAVVTGCIPVTGLPLPFLSYGGSSLLSTMIAVGIIMNLSKNIGGVVKS